MGETKEFKIRDGDPYYISGNDNPNISLVTTLPSGTSNQTWAMEFKWVLSTKNKAGFVDGTHIRPTNIENQYYITWIRYNNLVDWLPQTC